ncbi:MAG: 1,4-dihydroxy-2-naphthoate polyprenyltransferase, partial [Spirochaetia bacterium]|nr:1,4-dihydroxy-2-naphthoate polyprenyltransferase [Spirochaetia bacterium]
MPVPPKPSALTIWIIAARPKTLFASLAPILMGLGMAWGDRHFHAGIALLTVFCGVAVQVSANFINDYYDVLKGADEKNRLGPLRVTQAGW